MRNLVFSLLLASSACRTAPDSICSAVIGVGFKYQISPTEGLELFRFEGLNPSKGCAVPPNIQIGDAWLKTACLMLIMDETEPTYESGQSPNPMYIYYVFKPDRPDEVFRHVDSGSTPDDPIVPVFENVLETTGAKKGGWATCDGEIGRPAA